MMQWIVSSSVLIALVIALRFLLRGRISLRTQYALWALVLVRLLVPVSFGTSELSVMNAVPERTELVMQDYGKPTFREQGNTFTQSPVQDITEPFEPDIMQSGVSTTPISTVTEEKEIDYAAVAKTLWLVGAAAVGLSFLAVNLRFGRRLRRSRERVEEGDAALAVYATDAMETPCLFGLVRPAIYLTHATAADAETRRYALAHEQTHYRHGDHLWSALRCVCLALHWYNPLVWWAAELSRRDAELACDEATVRALGESERAAYGRTLIRMTCEKRPALLLTATTMTDNGRGLRERITLLVKKPKTAVYTAVAIVLVALIAVVCTFTGREAEPADPFGKTYPAVEIVYDAPPYNATFTEDTMPSVRLERDGVKLYAFTDNVYKYDAPEALTLTAESFDALFRETSDDASGWLDGMSAAALRSDNARAWSCTAKETVRWQVDFLYILQQKDGTLYLALGYESEAEGGAPYIRWLMRLGEAVDDTALETWDSMEAYVLSRINALKQPDAYTYTIIPEGHDGNDGKYEFVTETAVDVRVVQLTQSASCEGLSPDGTLELWIFDYEVKPEDKAGVLPERYYWVGGNSISDDGYISDSFYEYLTVLHRTDGGYQILKAQTANDGLWYNGNGYESESEYLYDFYIDYADLDLPPYYNEHGYHRFDGDGWYIYTPTNAWNRTTNVGEDCWYSAYLTGSTLRVDKYPDSVAAMEELYRTNGFTLEQAEGTTLSGPWCRYDAPSGVQYENYLASAADGGCYLISTYWQPEGGNTVGTWGEGEQEALVAVEAKALRLMAHSFTVGEVSGGVDADAPTFSSDWAKLDSVENFASYLTLSKNGAELGGYSLVNTWNTPSLNSYTFVTASAPATNGKMVLTMYLANNDSSYFEFYEGTNTVGYVRAGSREYYRVSDDFAVGDGVGLYDQIRGWYDEAELRGLRLELEETPIPDRGQTWEEAAQEWIDAYEGIYLAVTTGSKFKFTWVKNSIKPADDYMELLRERGELDENTYCFYTTTAFVAESDHALNYAIAGNTGDCTDPDAPEGAWEYYRCCAIRRTADGWVGTMVGTGW